MQPRTTVLIGLAAVLLGAFVFLYEIRGREVRDAEGTALKRLFPELVVDQMTDVTLETTDGVEAKLHRGDEGWRLSAPDPLKIDVSAVDALVAGIVALERDGQVDQGDDLSNFGLGAAARHLTFEADGQAFDLLIGKSTPVGANTYVLVAGSKRIDYVPTWRVNALRKSLKDLRDRRVLFFEVASIDQLEIRWPDDEVSLERRDGVWWLTSPLEEVADADTVDTLLDDLSYLRADGFVDSLIETSELGLEIPAFSARLSGPNEAGGVLQHDLIVGALLGGARVARGQGGHLFEIAAERLDDMPHSVVAYRNKIVSQFEVSDAKSFEIAFAPDDADEVPLRIQAEFSSSGWVSGPEPMSPDKAAAFVAELARLEGKDIIADALGEDERGALGLRPPRVQIRVWGSGDDVGPDPLLAELSLGDVHEGRGIMAKRRGQDLIFSLDEALAGELPTSAAAYRAEFVAPQEAPKPEIEKTEAAPVAPDDPQNYPDPS